MDEDDEEHNAMDTPAMPTTTAKPSPLSFEHAGPEIYKALAAAHAQVQTVGKDSENSFAHYRYASADNIIREARSALSEQGAFFVCSPEVLPPRPGSQGACALVRVHWYVVHAQTGQRVSGYADVDAIPGKGRPDDKAVLGAITTLRGYILLGLLNLDRAEEESHDVNRRDDSDYTPPARRQAERGDNRRLSPPPSGRKPPRSASRSEPKVARKDNVPPPSDEDATKAAPLPDASPECIELRREVGALAKEYEQKCKLAGLRPQPWLEIGSEAIGRKWVPGAATADEWRALVETYRAKIENLDDDPTGYDPNEAAAAY